MALPSLRHVALLHLEKGLATECAVCDNVFTTEGIGMTICGHCFCTTCLSKVQFCPACRHSLTVQTSLHHGTLVDGVAHVASNFISSERRVMQMEETREPSRTETSRIGIEERAHMDAITEARAQMEARSEAWAHMEAQRRRLVDARARTATLIARLPVASRYYAETYKKVTPLAQFMCALLAQYMGLGPMRVMVAREWNNCLKHGLTWHRPGTFIPNAINSTLGSTMENTLGSTVGTVNVQNFNELRRALTFCKEFRVCNPDRTCLQTVFELCLRLLSFEHVLRCETALLYPLAGCVGRLVQLEN